MLLAVTASSWNPGHIFLRCTQFLGELGTVQRQHFKALGGTAAPPNHRLTGESQSSRTMQQHLRPGKPAQGLSRASGRPQHPVNTPLQPTLLPSPFSPGAHTATRAEGRRAA